MFPQWKHKRHETVLTWEVKQFTVYNEPHVILNLEIMKQLFVVCCPPPEPQCRSPAGAALLRVEEHVQSDPWLQAESDASWELHGEDPGHLTGRERILDRAHVLLRPGRK